jgi:hypothetical protein
MSSTHVSWEQELIAKLEVSGSLALRITPDRQTVYNCSMRQDIGASITSAAKAESDTAVLVLVAWPKSEFERAKIYDILLQFLQDVVVPIKTYGTSCSTFYFAWEPTAARAYTTVTFFSNTRFHQPSANAMRSLFYIGYSTGISTATAASTGAGAGHAYPLAGDLAWPDGVLRVEDAMAALCKGHTPGSPHSLQQLNIYLYSLHGGKFEALAQPGAGFAVASHDPLYALSIAVVPNSIEQEGQVEFDVVTGQMYKSRTAEVWEQPISTTTIEAFFSTIPGGVPVPTPAHAMAEPVLYPHAPITSFAPPASVASYHPVLHERGVPEHVSITGYSPDALAAAATGAASMSGVPPAARGDTSRHSHTAASAGAGSGGVTHTAGTSSVILAAPPAASPRGTPAGQRP